MQNKYYKETRVVECAVKEIKLDVGEGDRLVLFKGDKIKVSVAKTIRSRYRVVDAQGVVIGHVTMRQIRNITNQPIRKGVRNGILENLQSV